MIQERTSCSHLEDYSEDACNISSCVDAVKGIPSDSASPTDTWFIHFKGDTFYNDVPIEAAFVKLWINVDSARRYAGVHFSDSFKFEPKFLEGLDYEVNVYRDVIRPLIDDQICPNFVRYLGSAKGCTYDDLLAFLNNSTTWDGVERSHDSWRKSLYRNMLYIRRNKTGRPSIDTDTKRITMDTVMMDEKRFLRHLTYNFVLTQPAPYGTVKLADYVAKHNYNIPYDVIMQLLMALYALDREKIAHNDLHSDNVLVAPVPKTRVTYVINGRMYSFDTSYKVLVYDFDRSYVERLGPNPALSDESNHFVPGKDAMKLFYYLIALNRNETFNYDAPTTKIVLRLLTYNHTLRAIKSVYANGPFLKYHNDKPVGDEVFNLIRPISEMINIFYVYMFKNNPPKETSDPSSIFRM